VNRRPLHDTLDALLAHEPESPSDAVAEQLGHAIQRSKVAVEDARRNLRYAKVALDDAERAVEQAVMAEAFLRSLAADRG
jgi:hypothetical protein